jgi:pimeloyl-ACP methyl ester carboxylesterase
VNEPATIAYPYGVNGVLVRVLEAGVGPKTIVLLHGLGARADRWRRNLGVLASAGFRVFALDLPGHGFSEKSGKFPHSVPEYARLVAAFVDSVNGRGTTILVGTSMGAHVAARATLADPDAYQGVVLVGPVGLRPLGTEARASIAGSIVDTSFEGIRRKMTSVVQDKRLVTAEWVREEYCINNSPGAAQALGAIAKYFAEDVDADALGEEGVGALLDAVPTMFVWGERDEIIPLSVAEEIERTHGVTATRIEGAAHLPYFENPNDFNSALVTFLGRREGVSTMSTTSP